MFRPRNGFHWKAAIVALAALGLAATPTRARAPAEPIAVMTVQSIDGALGSVRYVLSLAGKEEQARNLEAMLGTFTSGKNFQGIDTKKPLGAYVGQIGENPDEIPFAVFLPLTNQTEFVDLLKQMDMEPVKRENGIHSIETPFGITVGLKFAHGHAFFALSASVLAGDLPDPAKFVPKAHANKLIAATVRLDQISAEAKKQALKDFEAKYDAEKVKKEEESEEQFALRLAVLQSVREMVHNVVLDGQEMTFSFVVDQQEGNVALDLAMTARMGSRLAEKIQDLGPAQPVAPVHFEVSVGKLALLFLSEESDGKTGQIRKLFTGADRGKDKVRVSLYGGDALHLRLDVNAQVVKLVAALMPSGEPQ